MRNKKSKIVFDSMEFQNYRQIAEHVTLDYAKVKKQFLSKDESLEDTVKRLNPFYFSVSTVYFENVEYASLHALCVLHGVSSAELYQRLNSSVEYAELFEMFETLLMEKYMSEKDILSYSTGTAEKFCDAYRLDRYYYAYLKRKGVEVGRMQYLLNHYRDFLFVIDDKEIASFADLAVYLDVEISQAYDKAIEGSLKTECRIKPKPVSLLDTYIEPELMGDYISKEGTTAVGLLQRILDK